MEFLAPGFLVLLVLALAPWVGPFATRDRRHAALRSALVAALVFALARPVRVVADETVHHVRIVDRTASVPTEVDAALRRTLQQELTSASHAGRRFTVVELGNPGVGASVQAPLALPRDVRHIVIDGEKSVGSPLSAALAAAAAAVPVGAQGDVVVHTDGLSTDPADGSAAAHALADLAARGIEVTLAPLAGVPGDLRAVGLAPLGPLRSGLAATIAADLVGGGQVVTCRLVATTDGRELARSEPVAIDGEVRVPMTFTPERAGFEPVALELEVVDGVDPVLNVGATGRFVRTFAIDDPLRVLYLGERATGGAQKLGELLGGGFEVTDAAAAGDGLGEGLANADLVVLDDRPATSLPADVQRALVDAVASRGLGLVAAGGEASFGPGGYHEEPLEQLLPVEFVQKEEKRDPSTTLVVIIDTSGSMGGNRVQLAKEVARLAIRRLLPHDKVGMVEFYGAKRWAVPIQPASNSIEIERALNRLDAGGGTVILPAIEEAYYGLKNVRTRYKHVLILTDGGVETGAFEPLLRRMADEGMNVSTVLIGGDAHSEFLVNLSNWGQGRFYSVPNRFNLPEILLKQPASAKLPAYREGLAPVRGRGGEAWFGDVDPTTLPPVAGYVETRARPGAERVIETKAEGHPILASWRYGLGRVTALTTEPTGPGTAPWRDDSAYGDWLARALERSAADGLAPFAFELLRDGHEAVLVAERRAAAPDEVVPRADVWRNVVGANGADAGDAEAWSFQQVAPDRFEARAPLARRAGLCVECSAGANGARSGPVTRLTLAPLADFAAEHQVSPRAVDVLAAALSRAAGAVSAESNRSPLRLREYAPALALLALLLYLLDIAYRRWPRRSQFEFRP